MGATNLKLYAAEYADGYVFAIDEKNALYVMPDNDFANVTKIADLGAASGPLSYDFLSATWPITQRRGNVLPRILRGQ